METQEEELIDRQVYKIHHHYDIGNQAIYVSSKSDPTRAAVFCQFMSEEWFGYEHSLSNLAIANILVSLYGCWQAAETENYISIDMYSDREALCGNWKELKKEGLSRKELKIFIAPHIPQPIAESING